MFLIFIVTSYIIGSFPTSFIFVKLIKGIDIRKVGSGNVGATNASRILGIKLALLVLVIDILKGFLPILISENIFNFDVNKIILIGLFSIFGHIFPVFLKFNKSGKGVATSCGVFLALVPKSTVSVLIIFVILVAITRYISVGSIMASFLLPIFTMLFYSDNISLIIFTSIGGVIIILFHKKNIRRLLNGEELKFGRKTN